MLLRRRAGQRLEPMGIMGCALLQRPFLHLMGHHISHRQVKLLTLPDGLLQLLINLLRQTLLHHRIIKHIFAENLGNIRLPFHNPLPVFSLLSVTISHKKFLYLVL